VLEASRRPHYLPLPHPSWRNNAWIAANPWFDKELLPALRREIRALLAQERPAGQARNRRIR
jgi:uracil-DNA glycosylase